MPTVVVDASAIGAIIFGEPKGEAMLAQLAGCDLTAPPIIRHELISVALKKHRLEPDRSRGLVSDLRGYRALRIHEQGVVAAAVFELAIDTGLSAYDASYLWLARSLGVPLVTLDGGAGAGCRRLRGTGKARAGVGRVRRLEGRRPAGRAHASPRAADERGAFASLHAAA